MNKDLVSPCASIRQKAVKEEVKGAPTKEGDRPLMNRKARRKLLKEYRVLGRK